MMTGYKSEQKIPFRLNPQKKNEQVNVLNLFGIACFRAELRHNFKGNLSHFLGNQDRKQSQNQPETAEKFDDPCIQNEQQKTRN
jgi:hypothetical protein